MSVAISLSPRSHRLYCGCFMGDAPLLEPDCENTVFTTLYDIDDELTYVLNEELSLYYVAGKSGRTPRSRENSL